MKNIKEKNTLFHDVLDKTRFFSIHVFTNKCGSHNKLLSIFFSSFRSACTESNWLHNIEQKKLNNHKFNDETFFLFNKTTNGTKIHIYHRHDIFKKYIRSFKWNISLIKDKYNFFHSFLNVQCANNAFWIVIYELKLKTLSVEMLSVPWWTLHRHFMHLNQFLFRFARYYHSMCWSR